jgi:hypothetical protein
MSELEVLAMAWSFVAGLALAYALHARLKLRECREVGHTVRSLQAGFATYAQTTAEFILVIEDAISRDPELEETLEVARLDMIDQQKAFAALGRGDWKEALQLAAAFEDRKRGA